MKTKLVLMSEGKMDYIFDTKMPKPKKKELITIKIKEGGHISYIIEFTQYFFNSVGEFQYLIITAIKKS
jgi:hypothetical protein